MAKDFENAKTHNGIHYSRYIASWRRQGGMIYPDGLFEKWLREVEKLTDEEISDIMLLETNGKMELETSASLFMHLKENKEDFEAECVEWKPVG